MTRQDKRLLVLFTGIFYVTGIFICRRIHLKK